MKITKLFLVLTTIMSCSVLSIYSQKTKDNRPLKVLHLSFHLGCIKDFELVGKELGLDLTSWYILENKESHDRFDPSSSNSWNAIYNITHDRAKKVWEKNKDYFNQFDAIVTSDTAPLCRVFLQNDWKKPLIIWICNRFDYSDWETRDSSFPDAEYYELVQEASKQKNVSIIGYVAYEHFYAKSKGVDTGSLIIKPCGVIESSTRSSEKNYVPESVVKEETFFIPPRLEEHQIQHLISQCNSIGLQAYCGRYNGPHELKDFKGVINFPYAWSNLALFENIQLGLPMFIPTVRFLRELANSPERNLYLFFALENLEYSEWYAPENEDVFVYFDSWQDLQYKVQTLDFEELRKKTIEFGIRHKQEMLNRWYVVFDNAKRLLKIIDFIEQEHLALLD